MLLKSARRLKKWTFRGNIQDQQYLSMPHFFIDAIVSSLTAISTQHMSCFLRLPVISDVLKDKEALMFETPLQHARGKRQWEASTHLSTHESDQPSKSVTTKGFVFFFFCANQRSDKAYIWIPSSTGSSDWLSEAVRGNLRSTEPVRSGEDQAISWTY